jgi:aryl-alcohol dehydrogenase-like predicted oxidoreductase
MNYSTLGKSTLQISRIGFGCMSLEEDQQNTTTLLHRAIDLGINYFDTADLYQKGINEEMVGKALRSKRDQVILATKVGNQWKADGSGWDWNPRKEYILEAVEKSLRRLQTDHIDLYQLHGGTLEDPIDETIEAFEILQQQGKILYYGISSIRPNVIREWIKRSRMVSVMMQYSLLDRRPEESCLSLLKENNIGVLARGAVAKGLLAGKPAASFLNYDPNAVTIAANAIRDISKDRLMAHTAMQFVLQHPAITSAVVGIRNKKQLEEATGVFESRPLSGDEMKSLQDSIPVNYYESHR